MESQSASTIPVADIKFARQSGFFDRNPLLRAGIASVFALCLFAFLHFREVRVDMPELGSVADKFVVAQVDFTFLDEKATAIRREEAVRDIGKIFRLSETQFRERRQEFEQKLAENDSWRAKDDTITFEAVYENLEALEATLMRIRFTDARTLNKMHQVDLSTQDYLLFYARGSGEETLFPAQAWEQIGQLAVGDPAKNPSAAAVVITFFQEKGWLTEEDVPSQQKLRTLVQKQVPDKYTQVKSGQRVIDQGDKITTRHIAMLQAMKRAIADHRNLWHPTTLFGSGLMSLLLLAIGFMYLRHYHRDVLDSNRRLFLVLSIATITLLLGKGAEVLLLRAPSHLIDYLGTPIVVPVAAIITCCLLSSTMAIMISGFLTVVLSMGLAVDRNSFIVLNLAAAVVATLSTRDLRHRGEVFAACAKAWVACVAVLVSLRFYSGAVTSLGLFTDVTGTTLNMLLTGVLVVGLLPALESLFGIITDITLMEYMDPNNELLRRLAIEAPGTYQHSVVVGNLSEAGALAIGANGLFCRVSTLYHDIGKLSAPHYFTENQQAGMNMHQLLTPHESASVIIAHVSEGVALARKGGLPEPFIDIIKEHHGTTLVYYFYHKQMQLANGDPERVDAAEFRYSGPKPRTKESAIIMIADTLEAASRSLDEITEDTVKALLERLVSDKAEDGQFDECQLTFEELGIVKKAMIKTLLAAGHARIKYPKRLQPRDLPKDSTLAHPTGRDS